MPLLRGTGLHLRPFYAAGIMFALAACSGGGGAQNAGAAKPLAAVAPLPAPVVPGWIAQYGPKGQTQTLAQIRVIFRQPLIPLEKLESSDEAAKLSAFTIEPALPGHFRFLTPKMVGFQADRALPKATRVRVSVASGLTDLAGHRLDRDFSWTFSTEPVRLSNLPGGTDNADTSPVAPDQGFDISSNAELDTASLAANTSFIPKGSTQTVGATAQRKANATPGPEDNSASAFDASESTYVYTVKPAAALAKGQAYALSIAPGVSPAVGNMASAATFKGSFATYGPLRLTNAGPSQTDGPRFVGGDPQLKFNNGLNAASAESAITIEPAPLAGFKLLSVSDGDTTIALNPFALRPQTKYTVKIAATLRDQFAQTLEAPQTAVIATTNLMPDFWAPSGLNIFARTNTLKLNYSAVNLPSQRYTAAYRALAPPELAGADDAVDASSFLPAPATWSASTVTARKNEIVSIGVPVSEKLGGGAGVLAYGAGASPHDFQRFYGLVGLTNLGVFAQWFPQTASILVQHLADGSPAAQASIDVYRMKSRSPCASGTADDRGVFVIAGVDIERCSAGAAADAAPALFVAAREGADWTYTRVNDNTGYGYDVYLGWSNGKPVSRGTIFSDRQMYQPGERAAFTAMAYLLQNGRLKRDAGARYSVTIRDANGKQTDFGAHTTDSFGIISIPWSIRKDQPLGQYSIKATGPQGNELYGDFRVAEFKPPNFNVTLALDKTFATPGATVNAEGTSKYLFGAPLQGGRAHYYVTRSQAYLAPKGWDAFQFGRQWFWPDQAPSIDSDVLQKDATLDAQGRAIQAVSVPADLPFPMSYRVDMDVTDVSNLSVSDSQSFTAVPDQNAIGLQSDFVGDANKPVPVKVIVTNQSGGAQSGVAVHLELQSMDYSSATQLIEGGQAAANSVKYTTVDQADVTPQGGPATASLKASKAGAYRIRANFSGAKSDASETDTQIWISGGDAVRWNSDNPTQLKISLDKKTYRAGDEAIALIQSPYPQADVYFSVVRDRPIYQKIVHVSGGAPQIRFRVTPDMLPNAAAEAVLVRRGKPLQQIAAGSLDSLDRIGFAPFSIALDDKYLQLRLTPQRAKVAPGETQRVTLTLKDRAGRPAPGEFTIMVVNDAILQLTGYRLPDLVKTVYADQPVSVRFNDNRSNVVLSPLTSPVAKGFGYGGGFLEGSGGTRVRRNFQQLAYYAGALRAGADGKASIAFAMPDDLTTWRVMAVASGGNASDFRFATADTTFVSTRPLMLNPLLPQFARTGDTLAGGAAVTNTTASGTLALTGTLSGALRFGTGDPLKNSAEAQLAPGTQALRFPMTAGSGAATVTFDGKLGTARDAFSVPFEIRNAAATETVAQSGTTETRVTIPVSFTQGTLNLWLGSSVIPQIIGPGEALLRDREPLPFAEIAASRLAVAAALRTLANATGQKPSLDLAAEARADLAALHKSEAPDGGVAQWPGGTNSDPVLGAYVAQSLGDARAAELPGDAALAGGLRKTLSNALADPGRLKWCNTLSCKTFVRLQSLIGLSALGDHRTSFLADIIAQSDTLGTADRARLAQYLLQTPGYVSTGHGLLAKLEETLSLTARNAAMSVPQHWGWYDSAQAAQAEMLTALTAAHAPGAVTDGVVRTLTTEHCTCSFTNTFATALRLRALASYARTQPANPNFSATVTAGSKTLAQASFAGRAAPPKHVSMPAAALAQSRSMELAKTGSGTLHYVVDFRYELTGPQPGALGGLRVTRYVRPANGKTVLAQMGLQKPQSAFTLAAGNVFDIGLEVIADHPLDNVVMTDALPAGLEAVDASFQTSNPYFQAGQSWQIDYQTIYKDRVVAFANHLDAGVYTFHYLVRSVTPGTFAWPGGEAHAQYAPEDFGRTAAAVLTIPQ